MSYLRKLNKAYAQLSNAKDLDDLLRLSIKAVKGTLGFDRAGFLLFDAQTQEQVGTWGIDAHGKLRNEHGLRYPITDDHLMLDSSESIRLIRNKSLNDMGEAQGVGWHVQAMVSSEKELFGWLFVDNLVNGKDISQEEFEVLETFSTVLGQLIIRAKIEDTLNNTLKSLAEKDQPQPKTLSELVRLDTHIHHTNESLILAEKLIGLVPMSTRYIGNLVNFISLLSPKQFDSANIDLLDTAKSSANRLSRIFRFVDARVHATTNDKRQTVSCAAVAEYWQSQFQPLFDKTTHSLILKVDQPELLVTIPLLLLTQLVKELMSNALYHGLESTTGGQVSIKLASQGGLLTVTIDDNGIGLESSQLNEVSKLFVTSKPNENLGTGLNVVQHYAERWLNGQLELSESTQGGLQATLTFPASQEQA
ncbi:HAMP domain-containing histidine kinase [Reinekea forsetii]|nr:HAMP domain-containing histidine kinase [Reinekea forsetii]